MVTKLHTHPKPFEAGLYSLDSRLRQLAANPLFQGCEKRRRTGANRLSLPVYGAGWGACVPVQASALSVVDAIETVQALELRLTFAVTPHSGRPPNITSKCISFATTCNTLPRCLISAVWIRDSPKG